MPAIPIMVAIATRKDRVEDTKAAVDAVLAASNVNAVKCVRALVDSWNGSNSPALSSGQAASFTTELMDSMKESFKQMAVKRVNLTIPSATITLPPPTVVLPV